MKKVAVVLLIACSSARAIIFYSTGDPTYNSTAPTGDLANSGWQYEGNWLGLIGTPIAPNFFIAAHHIGGNVGDVFNFDNQTFTTTAVFDDPTSDLRIWQVNGTFPFFAPLYTNQDEVGQLVVDFGHGTQRGSEIDLDGNLQGWGWGPSDGVQRWGENIVSSIYNNGVEDDLLRATFDQNGIANECTLSSGDSSGGAFINDGGTWKLAGINYGVDGPFYTDSSGDPTGGFDAALIEMGGFWQQNGTPPPDYVQISGPSAFYPTRISTKIAWIYSVIDPTGDPDNDGIPNLMEYALHSNPLVSDVTNLPQVALGNNLLTLTYTKVTTATDITYTVQQSSDLVSWTSATTQDTVLSTNGNLETIQSAVDVTGVNVLFPALECDPLMPGDSVKLIECPRDAWQGLKRQIPTDLKVDYLRALISAGFKHIDAVSFVSPKAVPQMADSEAVLAQLQPPKEVEIIGIVVNEKGAERAIATNAVTTLGYPYSISETFLRKNQNQSRSENLETLKKIKSRADETKLRLVVYVSMAFGNPYGDRWDEAELKSAIQQIADLGARTISLADTVGLASADLISRTIEPLLRSNSSIEIGVHMHSTREESVAKVLAAYDAGCRRFDSAIGGLGGCPFAQNALVGNIPTDSVVEALKQRDIDMPLPQSINHIADLNADIGHRFA